MLFLGTVCFTDIHTQKKEEFLTLRTFDTTSECIAAAKAIGAELWATDLAPGALPLLPDTLHKLGAAFPRRVALVLGAESIGISDEMRSAAQIRLYLPIYGFSDSLNVSVAAALVLQRLFDVWLPCDRAMLTRGVDVPNGTRPDERRRAEIAARTVVQATGEHSRAGATVCVLHFASATAAERSPEGG